MCCGCKGGEVLTLTKTAEIQSYIKSYGPIVVGMPVYQHMYAIGSEV